MRVECGFLSGECFVSAEPSYAWEQGYTELRHCSECSALSVLCTGIDTIAPLRSYDTGDRRVVGNFVREYLVGECTALLASGSKPTTRKAASCSTENSEV